MTGYYSLIRYVPDVVRKEFLNIGVLVFFPNHSINFEISFDEKLISKLDPSFKPQSIESFKRFLEDTFAKETYELYNIDSNSYVKVPVRSADAISEIARVFQSSKVQMTDIMKIDLESDIDDHAVRTITEQLLSGFVTRRKLIKEKSRNTQFKTKIKRVLNESHLLAKKGETLDSRKVIAGYIKPGVTDWTYDFAMKNGQLNVFEAVDFSKYQEPKGALGVTGFKYMKFAESPEIDREHKYSIVKPSELQYESFEHQIELLDKHSQVVLIKSDQDMFEIVNKIHKIRSH